MGIVIIQVVLTLLNLLFVWINMKSKNYKGAVFNSFAAGFILMGALYSI